MYAYLVVVTFLHILSAHKKRFQWTEKGFRPFKKGNIFYRWYI